MVVSDHVPPFGVLFYPFEGQRRMTKSHLPIDGLSSVRNKCKSTPLMQSDQLSAVDGVPGAAGFGAYRTVQLVFGYKGKQVRDDVHSFDLVEAFVEFIRAPRSMSLKGGKKAAFFDCPATTIFSFYSRLCRFISFTHRYIFRSLMDCEPVSAPRLVAILFTVPTLIGKDQPA